MKHNQPKIIGEECRFVTHVKADRMGGKDTHVLKLQTHYDDGSVKPTVKIIKGYKRPYWVTKPIHRNHIDKKEWEDISKLDRYECQQDQLSYYAARSLGTRVNGNSSVKRIASSPYLYGTDLPSTSMIKYSYEEKYPELKTPYTVAAFDTETDVIHGTGEIIITSLTMDNKIFLGVSRVFLTKKENWHDLIDVVLKKHMSKYIKKRNLDIEVYVGDSEFAIVKETFRRIHEWKPDILAIWNISFDIPKVINACAKVNVDPKDLFSDPDVARKDRYFKWILDKSKIQKGGKYTEKKPVELWHSVISTSSFYVICAMRAYKQIRAGGPVEPVGLDYVLNKHLNVGKFKIKEADKYVGIDYHRIMQTDYKYEYIAYAAFDTIGMLELDEITNDLSLSLPTFCGITDFRRFTSQPTKIASLLFTYAYKQGFILASVPLAADVKESRNLGVDDWIITLSAYMTRPDGLKCIQEDEELVTMLRGHVYDADLVSSYPYGILSLNTSKETTNSELIEVSGIPREVFMHQNINLTSGNVNAVEYCTKMFNFPELSELAELYRKKT